MAEQGEPRDAAFNMQLVREFLERHFTIENEIKLTIEAILGPRAIFRLGQRIR